MAVGLLGGLSCHGPVDLLQSGFAVEDEIDAGNKVSEGEDDDADVV